MVNKEKVIKGFTVCSEHGLLNGEDCHGHYEYTDNLENIIKANDYSKQCPYNGCKTGCVRTLAKNTLDLLKEQESLIHFLEHQREKGHWIFGNTNGHGWMKCSQCCVSQDGQTACYTFCPNCGADMSEGR